MTVGAIDAGTASTCRPRLRMAVLASGRGSNLEALMRACDRGDIDAQVVALGSDRPGCGALRIAHHAGIPGHAARPRDFGSRALFDAWLFDAIAGVQPDLIVCAGYMRLIGADTVRRLEGRMINIHPSLLPRHTGLDTHARALAAGDAEHGASVHFVIPALDAGPVIAQVRIRVHADDTPDTLATRVLAREHALLCRSVGMIASGRIHMRRGGVEFDGVPLATPLQLNLDDMLVTGECG